MLLELELRRAAKNRAATNIPCFSSPPGPLRRPCARR